jgi:hypothetical protein
MLWCSEGVVQCLGALYGGEAMGLRAGGWLQASPASEYDGGLMGHRTSDLEMIIMIGDQREVGAVPGAELLLNWACMAPHTLPLGPQIGLCQNLSSPMGRTIAPPQASQFSLGGRCQGVGAAVTDPWIGQGGLGHWDLPMPDPTQTA